MSVAQGLTIDAAGLIVQSGALTQYGELSLNPPVAVILDTPGNDLSYVNLSASRRRCLTGTILRWAQAYRSLTT